MGENGDSYTEVTEQSWGSRLMDSIKGVLVGVVLFIAAFPVLWMNEGCSVKTAKGLDEGQKAAISVKDISKVDAANNGKLVHMMGDAVTDEVLSDGTMGVSQKGIGLSRSVEMYQWKEVKQEKKEKKMGGKEVTTTTYTYEKDWSSTRNDSSSFKKPDHPNNPAMAYKSESWKASLVKFGGFRLSPSLIGQISKSEALPLEAKDLAKLPADIKAKAKAQDGGIYVGGNSSAPEVGDLRIKFTIVKSPQKVSILSKQMNDTFEAYKTATDTTIDMLSSGEVSKDSMIQQAKEANVFRTWMVRLLGFILMFAGVSMIFKPLATLGDVVPVIGSVISMGTGIVAFVIALPLTLLTIALAWIAHRPVLGVILLLIAGGVAGGIFFYAKQKKAKAAA